LNARIPVEAVEGAAFWPRFEEGAIGAYRSGKGAHLDFTVNGRDDIWDTWTLAAADGTNGIFTLGDQFAGSGTLSRDGTPIGALRWPELGAGALDLVAAGTTAVGPSAAARDFQMDRWISNIAAMGPMPVY
jgi:hypothetical protein